MKGIYIFYFSDLIIKYFRNLIIFYEKYTKLVKNIKPYNFFIEFCL